MSGSRSTRGCYTCRVRKKKCDEGRPTCTTCSSRAIRCYGYGVQPSWFKYVRSEGHRIKEVEEIRYAAELSYELTYRPNKVVSLDVEAEGDETFTSTTISRYKSQPPSSLWWHSAISTTLPVQNIQETDLLRHYLTEVFDLQFGFYNRSKGRHDSEWFTDFLIHSKPLYNSALSVTACYQIMLREGSTDGEVRVSKQLTSLHITSLKEVQKHINDLSSLQGAELLSAAFATLAAINQLLSLELFRTIQGDWEIHLEGARRLLSIIDTRPLSNTTIQTAGQLPIPSSITSVFFNPGSITPASFSILSFLVTAFIFADIISYATFHMPARTAPQFYYQHLLSNSPPLIDLSQVMGCQNSSMIALLKISELRDWKSMSVSTGTVYNPTLIQKSAELGLQLQMTLSNLSDQLSSSTKLSELALEKLLVTRIFTRAALVYLYVVVAGAFPFIPAIQTAVGEAITDLEDLPGNLLIRVSWPVCVIGCMASGADEERISEVIQQAMLRGDNMGTVWKGYKIINECWRLRRMGEKGEVDWLTGMASLGVRILLA